MTKKSKVLWLDCDGVLLEWVKPFLAYINSPVSYDDLVEYDLSPLFPNGVEEMVRTINEFNASPHYAVLKPLISPKILSRLKSHGYNLKAITQVDGDIAREQRIYNLHHVFGTDMFSEIILVGRGTSKAEWLRREEPYEVITIVEDNPTFFKEAGHVGGFRALAIQHPYNRFELKALPNVPIYMGMSELVRDLCSRE